MNNKNDTKLKILSVLLAIFMWTFVINSTNPTVNKTYRNIPVVIKNQDNLEKSGYTIVGNDESLTTNIKLKGTREKLVGLKTSNIYAYIDIADVKEGIQSVEIVVDTPTGVTVDELEPEEINLNIQKVIEKTLPVNLIISDKIKDGRIVEVNELSPEDIKVKGPASYINKIDRAEVRIEDMDLLDGKIHSLPVAILDRSGNKISGLDISNDDINVSFLVYETKKVPVNLNTTGELTQGFEESSREVSPNKVVIKGPESIIRDIEQINTKPININNLKSSSYGDVRLDLPEYVEVYNGENLVNYRIDVQKKSTNDKDDGKEEEKKDE
ncbi:MAG: CdaR family protein [Anaerococcus sp.]|uniref:CdaR family protein n=1 Tax=Anaerococcus TaxID=165779 RepID=UPI001AEAB0CE|nr:MULTISPECIES: CdaR family protein [Anaerococcus]MBP2068870.1 YbbR domain-containing protein [Anaerococcus nagyae]MDU1865211.1 CdaR family protein [Anaerococcus sp.]MDU2352981.1 CdaR family protein [Anaerococcus sp.]MDU2566007.1 CdaR family protein [Anaerococcus sp.]